jgi:hypothetical protein
MICIQCLGALNSNDVLLSFYLRIGRRGGRGRKSADKCRGVHRYLRSVVLFTYLSDDDVFRWVEMRQGSILTSPLSSNTPLPPFSSAPSLASQLSRILGVAVQSRLEEAFPHLVTQETGTVSIFTRE